jgi:threonine aldolase
MMPTATPLSTAEIQALRNRCTRWLSGHRPLRSMRESLLQLAELPEAAQALDLYGEGEAIQALEAELAVLLGKPAARFFHKGVAAQLAAVQTWLDLGPGRAGFDLGLHRQSHLEVDEALAYEQLMRWRSLRLGETNAPQTLAELLTLRERPRVLMVELPLRRAGFLLPDWDELCAISAWCREQGVVLHIDGARLWEASAHYGRSLAEIAALADSVYLSFYKGLGGLAGSVLVGPADFIAATAPWQMRLAGNLYTVYPMVLSALDGLRRHLPRMREYRDRARALAACLGALPGVRVWPDPPQTNSFQVHLPVAPECLRAALIDFAGRERVWLGARAAASIWPGHSMVEIVLGDAAEDWTDAEAQAWWQVVLAQASV